MNIQNPFERKFTQIAQQQDAAKAADIEATTAQAAAGIFADKPYTSEWRGVYRVACAGRNIAQVVTFIGTASLGVFALSHLVPGAVGFYISIPIGAAVAFGIERVKRATVQVASKHYLKYKRLGVGLGIVCVAVMCVSIAAAIFGASELPEVIYPKTARELVTTPKEQQLQATLNTLTSDIAQAEKKLQTAANWALENRELPRLKRERDRVAAELAAEQGSNTDRGEAATIEREADRQAKISKLRVYCISTAVFFEAVFLACMAFILYYLFRAYAEAAQQPTANKTGFRTAAQQQAESGIYNETTTTARAEIQGFARISGNVCANDTCGAKFEQRTTFHKYCSEACRVEAWERKTGRTARHK